MKQSTAISVALSACIGLASDARLAESADLAQQAYSILMTQCYRCHGNQKRVEGFDVSSRDSLVSEERQYVVPKDLENSQIWTRVAVYEDMPPKGNPEKLTSEDREILKQWILSGAPFPPPEQPRTPLDEAYVLTSIDQYLTSQVDRENWKHQRFFSLAHLYNNPAVTDYHLRLYRAALSKVINSLSRQPQITLPKGVDKQHTIYSIDLRDVGWTDSEQWLQVLQLYPYGLVAKDTDDLVKTINERLGGGNRFRNPIPYVHADWFIVEAARPPLYDALLKLPDNEQGLLEELGVEFERDFESNKVVRAAFTASGVSRHNRLIDRLSGRNTGYYYRSHDFGKSFDRALLSRFPLGPKFNDNPFNDFAYEHDGGEIVFRLANGLQGYLIVDGQGKRISEAPVAVVRDLAEISGSPTVVNGISCMGCHATGIQPYQDNLRQFVRLTGAEGSKFKQLYRDSEELSRVQNADRQSFLTSLAAAIGPFLQQGEDQNKPLDKFPEPIREVAGRYDGGVGLEEAAFGLGAKPEEFRQALLHNPRLSDLGLGPLLSTGNRVPRKMWDSRDDRGISLFQAAASEFDATPISIPRNPQ